MMADSIEHVVSYWMVFQKFHSPALGGYAVISHWVPFLLFSVATGALADRFDPRRIIQTGMVLFMLCSVAWGVLFMTGTLEVWHAVVIFTVHGIAGVLWGPAAQMMVHDIVGPGQLHSAVRLMSMSRVVGQLGGPAIGGALPLVMVLHSAFSSAPDLSATRLARERPFGQPIGKNGWPRRAPDARARRSSTAREIAGNRMVVSMTLPPVRRRSWSATPTRRRCRRSPPTSATATLTSVQHAACRQRGRCALRRHHPRDARHPAGQSQGGIRAGAGVLPVHRRLRALEHLCSVARAAVRGGFSQPRLWRNVANAGPDACAAGRARPRARPLQRQRQRHACLFRSHGRHGRQPHRRALPARDQRGAADGHRGSAARLRPAAWRAPCRPSELSRAREIGHNLAIQTHTVRQGGP